MSFTRNVKTRCARVKLLLMCRYTAINLAEDLNDFATVAPNINEDFLANFKQLTEDVSAVIGPVALRKDAKAITQRINDRIAELSYPVNCLELLIDAEYEYTRVSSHDFGIDDLRHALTARKKLAVLPALKTVIDNMKGDPEMNMPMNFSPEILSIFESGYEAINLGLSERYAIQAEIKKIVQENGRKAEQLFTTLRYIQFVGRMIYRYRDPAKALLYNFSSVMKSIAPAARKTEEPAPAPPAV